MKKNGFEVWDEIPEGWKRLEGATTAPRGYVIIYNGKSLFGGERRMALVPEDVAYAWRDAHKEG